MPSCTSEEYYRRVLYIPYMDSIISSLAARFRDDNTVPYSLLALHPHQMTSIDKATFILTAKRIEELYGFDNFTQESCTWYDLWKNRQTTKLPTERTGAGAADMDLAEVIQHATPTLFPAVNAALNTALALPASTCSVERSFSTLRRVKTWLRATMSDERLSGLCMLSVHRDKIMHNRQEAFLNTVVNRFGQSSRRLQFLFSDYDDDAHLSSTHDPFFSEVILCHALRLFLFM